MFGGMKLFKKNLALCIALVLLLSGCGEANQNVEKNEDNNQEITSHDKQEIDSNNKQEISNNKQEIASDDKSTTLLRKAHRMPKPTPKLDTESIYSYSVI